MLLKENRSDQQAPTNTRAVLGASFLGVIIIIIIKHDSTHIRTDVISPLDADTLYVFSVGATVVEPT